MPGYIKLYRDLQNNPLWFEKPYTRGQAWVDMLFRCNHVCVKMPPQYQGIWVLRGQFLLSNLKLAEAWGWDEKKVRRFMDYLVSEGMIRYFPHNKFCVYECTKYAELQASEIDYLQAINAEQTPNKSRTNAEQTPTNNNDNNVNNEKKDIYISAQHLSITKIEYDKLVSLYGQSVVDSKIEYARNYKKLKNYVSLYLTLNNWLKADQQKKGDNPNGQHTEDTKPGKFAGIGAKITSKVSVR